MACPLTHGLGNNLGQGLVRAPDDYSGQSETKSFHKGSSPLPRPCPFLKYYGDAWPVTHPRKTVPSALIRESRPAVESNRDSAEKPHLVLLQPTFTSSRVSGST